MCIICVSKSGEQQPADTTLRAMFRRNPHGAGYMYARDGKVTIHKGFMNIEDFLSAVHAERFTPQDSVVYHFRISTQAGVNAAMTHPFPLSNQPRMMRALDLTCRCGIACADERLRTGRTKHFVAPALQVFGRNTPCGGIAKARLEDGHAHRFDVVECLSHVKHLSLIHI